MATKKNGTTAQAKGKCPKNYVLDHVLPTARRDTKIAYCRYDKPNPFDTLTGMEQGRAVKIMEEGGEFSCQRLSKETVCTADKGWEVRLKHGDAPFGTHKRQKEIAVPVTDVTIKRMSKFRPRKGGR